MNLRLKPTTVVHPPQVAGLELKLVHTPEQQAGAAGGHYILDSLLDLHNLSIERFRKTDNVIASTTARSGAT